MIIYRFFKYLFLNIKYTKILNKVYNNEKIIENLSNLFKSQFKKDWIGRLYTVINPNLLGDDFDINTIIYEYDESGLNNYAFVERCIMTKLNIAQSFIQTNNLFDLLTYKIEKLDEYDNYLFIIEPITLQDCLKYTKYFSILLRVLIVLFALFCTLLAVTVGLLLRIVCAVTPVGTLTFFAALAAASKAVLLALAAAFATFRFANVTGLVNNRFATAIFNASVFFLVVLVVAICTLLYFVFLTM